MKQRAWIQVCLSLLTLLWACGGNEAPKPEMAVRLAGKTSAPGLMPPKDQGSPTSPPGPLSLTGEGEEKVVVRVVRSASGVGVRVINGGARPLSLAARVVLSAVPGTGAEVRGDQALTLQNRCDTTGCVGLAPGAEVDAPVWLERATGERCGALIVPVTPGSYRLRVQTCAGKAVADAEFVWPIQ